MLFLRHALAALLDDGAHGRTFQTSIGESAPTAAERQWPRVRLPGPSAYRRFAARLVGTVRDMSENANENWVDGTYESGADPAGGGADAGTDAGAPSQGAPGAEIGQGEASTFEPEEDGPVDAEPT